MNWVFAPYALAAFTSTLNAAGMLRLPRKQGEAKIVILVPARNEESNLPRLLNSIARQVPVIVFDDESTDRTAELARESGATVIQPSEPLPTGWTGKNRACAALCRYALEQTDADWLLLLDADTELGPDFLPRIMQAANEAPARIGVLTGIPQVAPGVGAEPLVSAWVGWIILASNPFALVDRSGIGHNMFLNGQIQAWRRSTYETVQPHQRVKGRVMEDVAMGRMLGKERIGVRTYNLTDAMTVRMYETWRQALDGFSKNSFEITNSYVGSGLLALLLLVLGWLWLLEPMSGLLLLWSGLMVSFAAKAAKWPVLLMPVALSIGAFTVLRSAWWRRTGRTTWKNRTYP